jgi:hypothetical protein
MHEPNYFVIVLVLQLVVGFFGLRFDYDHEHNGHWPLG